MKEIDNLVKNEILCLVFVSLIKTFEQIQYKYKTLE